MPIGSLLHIWIKDCFVLSLFMFPFLSMVEFARWPSLDWQNDCYWSHETLSFISARTAIATSENAACGFLGTRSVGAFGR